ncbi:MAG: DUF4143 domain-containing protein [Burkholderiaceae bacterium]|nr:DUF4143 domain-containing protein [Burkholderiaceae bacterium]
MRSPWNANVSSNRLEVDLIVQGQGALIPIEIKLTATPLPHGATAMPWHEFPNWLNQQTG